jgi:uncharacterized protein YdaT
MSVTIRECVSKGHEWVDRTYSDEEIRDLFDDDNDTLVIALLNRAQKAEKELAKLKEERRHEGIERDLND